MENIPAFVPYVFMAIAVAVVAFLIYASHVAAGKKNNTPTIVLTFLLIWLFLIALVTLQGIFEDTQSFPPRLFIPIAFSVLIMIGLFSLKNSRDFILDMPITTLTYLHIIRVPVELVLWWLATAGAIPMVMTFEGSNFDILMGVTAPFAAVFLVGMRSKSTFAAIIWNIAGLIFLFNIIVIGIKASPYFFESSGYDSPNLAMLSFPFVWLPTFIVPVVLFAHLASIIKLLKGMSQGS